MGGCTYEGEELDEDGRRWKKGKGPWSERSLAFLEPETRNKKRGGSVGKVFRVDL